jgi:hypothetical protein
MPKDWSPIIESASKSPLGILALMILVLGGIGYIFFKKANAKTKAVMFVLMLGGVVGYGTAISRSAKDGSYRVRVIVIDAEQIPVSGAKVWSSIGGEPLRVEGGWLFVIAEDTKPTDGKVTLYASKDAAFLKGQSSIQLGDDRNPSVTVQLAQDRSANVIGIVVDERQSAVAGATVTVIGYDLESAETKNSGSFSLPAHAADGQQVELHAEKPGYRAANKWCPAGNSPCSIVLHRH